jgi:hypothetical protein
VISYVLSIGTFFLAVLGGLLAADRQAASWRRRAVLTGIAAVLASAPIGGWPLPRWLAGFGVSPSVTSAALLLAFVWGGFSSGRNLLDGRAWRTAWLFGGLTGVILYPMALGLGTFDPYALGWGGVPLLAAFWVLTIGLLWAGNRFALVLALGILAYDMGLLESSNLWDYLTDPLFTVASLVALASSALGRLRQHCQVSRARRLDPANRDVGREWNAALDPNR